jgi:cobalamin biosynthesis Mg chelatase CobN
MKKIQDVLDEVDLDVNELPEPTQRRVQTYAKLEKQLIAAKLELEALDEPNPEKQQVYEDAITYFNDYEADVIQSIQAYANRLEHELQAKAMKERRDRELQAKENENRIKARKEAEEKENQARLRAKKEAEARTEESRRRAEANQKRAKEEMSVAQAKAEEEAQKAQSEAEEKARLEAEASKPKKKSGGLGFILAGLGIVAAVVTFGATRDK